MATKIMTSGFSFSQAGVTALLLAGCAMASGGALAQAAWPTKPIQVIVPLQVGSAADVTTRVVVAKMGENMKQTFIIENQAGVSGLLGAERVARAAPDGYTLGGITDSVLNYAVNLSDKVNFDPLEDFAPISQMVNISWVLVVNDGFPAKTLADLLSQAGTQPGKIDYATGGTGSPHHIAMELFASGAGVSFAHVPYKGATQATTDVAGGQVPMMFSAVSVVLPFLKDGKLRALAQPNDKRSALLPDVPTFTEAGVEAFRFSTWLGLYAPKGTPADIVEKLNAEVGKAVSDPAVRNRLASIGLEPVASAPAELGTLTRDGYARVGQAIRDAGIKPQ